MEIDAQTLEVKNNREANRFEAQLGDQLGIIEYQIKHHAYVFTHTEVPPEFGGKGIADRMARVALDTAKAEGYGVVPLCPFVRKYIQRHPEYQALVTALEE